MEVKGLGDKTNSEQLVIRHRPPMANTSTSIAREMVLLIRGEVTGRLIELCESVRA